VFANHEAISLSRRAIANAEKLRGAERLSRVLVAALHLARLHLTLSQFDEAIEDFALAEKTALELGDKEAQIDAIGAGLRCRFSIFIAWRKCGSRPIGHWTSPELPSQRRA
jgi:hypothetical protein